MPFGHGNVLNDILRRMGVGTYETANGQTITNDQLPPEVKERVEGWAATRDLDHMAGDSQNRNPGQQQVINKLYDPATRDAMMRASGPGVDRFTPQDALQNYDQEQGMDQMMNEITNALAKRKIRATRSR